MRQRRCSGAETRTTAPMLVVADSVANFPLLRLAYACAHAFYSVANVALAIRFVTLAWWHGCILYKSNINGCCVFLCVQHFVVSAITFSEQSDA